MGRPAALHKGFTDKYIQNLKPKDKGYIQREGRGFAIRVQPTGFKTFLYVYTEEGKTRYCNLGNYPAVTLAQAREEYQLAYNKVQKGIPLVIPAYVLLEPQAPATTFGAFSKLYIKLSKEKHVPLWHTNVKSCLENDALPQWEDKEIKSITRREVIKLLELKEETAPGRVPALKRAISGVFQYALQRDYLDYNPSAGIASAVKSLRPKARQRVLTDDEIRHVWHSLGEQSTHRALRLILFTAQRPGEVAGMHRREIQGNTWVIPQERAEKGKGSHVVHLTKTALEIIGDAPGYIFDIERNSISRTVQQTCNFFGLPRWTPHDLRRTARTLLAKLGVPDEHAEAVIAHSKQGIKAVYNQWQYQDEKKAALILLEQELLRIITKPQTEE